MTNGSWGRLTSLGVKSVEDALREPTLRAAASALALGLMEPLEGPGVDGEGNAEPVPEPLTSEAVESVLGPNSTVRLLRFCVGSESGGGGMRGIKSGSGGASAAGIGRPRAAAMSWCSAQLSDQSLRPRQKGASFRSIWLFQVRICSLAMTPGLAWITATHLQLSDNSLVEILRPHVRPHGNEISAIDMFLSYTPFAVLGSEDSLALQLACFSLLFCLAMFKRGVGPLSMSGRRTASQAEEASFSPAQLKAWIPQNAPGCAITSFEAALPTIGEALGIVGARLFCVGVTHCENAASAQRKRKTTKRMTSGGEPEWQCR